MFMTGKLISLVLLATSLSACDDSADPSGEAGRMVETSGKVEAALADVPAAAIDAAQAARPDLNILEAEYEVRDDREYYDVGGTLPDGSELELDMTKIDGVWTVVEIQRDIEMDILPAEVGAALAAYAPDWQPDRIIESDQGDSIVIYEFFGPGESAEPLKIEVKFENGDAEVLAGEWIH